MHEKGRQVGFQRPAAQRGADRDINGGLGAGALALAARADRMYFACVARSSEGPEVRQARRRKLNLVSALADPEPQPVTAATKAAITNVMPVSISHLGFDFAALGSRPSSICRSPRNAGTAAGRYASQVPPGRWLSCRRAHLLPLCNSEAKCLHDRK